MNAKQRVNQWLTSIGWPAEVLSDPMNRERGVYVAETVYEDYYAWTVWDWKTTESGDLLRSVVPGTGKHAPVFDVDMVASVTLSGRGFTKVYVDGPVDRARLRRRVRRLARAGHVPGRFVDRMRADLAEQIASSGRHGPVSVYLAYPVRVLRSTTPSHRHLYVDALMEFRESVKLARMLGFVDHDFVRASKGTGYWVVHPHVHP